ncbi:hypothetical protein BUBS_222 [Bacillus phage Bubs]|uniref:hypothetical protein n=1 Tax=Bacillus phage Nemo TaxID=1805950 RepID=UPI0007A7774F|nr:hypothetical protein BI006_gp221 [Bacillus phage Nemo]AMW63737.1 hypothetical protein NEMO_221 [Bacillus phage Nemo]ASR78566.1 hypothetical protein BUBS_222 [Bacillus phage Bubs]
MKYKIFREIEIASAFMSAIGLGYLVKETTLTNTNIVLGLVIISLTARLLKGEKPSA